MLITTRYIKALIEMLKCKDLLQEYFSKVKGPHATAQGHKKSKIFAKEMKKTGVRYFEAQPVCS